MHINVASFPPLCVRHTLLGLLVALSGVLALKGEGSSADESAQTAPALDLSFDCIPGPGFSYAKAFFSPKEAPELRVRFLTDRRGLGDISVRASLFDFWGSPAGSVSVVPADTYGEYYDFVLKPHVSQLGWFRLELDVTVGGAPVKVSRRVKDAKSAEKYDFIAFAIVPEPRSADQTPSSPFGLMTALVEQPFCPIAAQLDLASYSGARWAREIVSWAKANPAPGTYVWSERKAAVRSLAARGLHILGMIQTSPVWTHPNDLGEGILPVDLLAAHEFANQLGQAFRPYVEAWEIWNEHDIKHYSIDGPDRYASVVKAMALGFAKVTPRPTILLGPFARDPRAGRYADILAQSEIASYVDAYPFHTYAPVLNGKFEKVVDVNLAAAQLLGLGAAPMWLTETSVPYARNSIPDPLPAMNAQVAQLHVSYLTAMAKGVRPIFWFILRPYISRYTAKPSQWGMVDTQLSPLPAFAAYAAMTNQLGAGEFVGEIHMPGQVRAYLLNDGHEEVAVVIPGPGQDEIGVPSISDSASVYDVMGNEITVSRKPKESRISTKGYAIYIRKAGWSGLVSQPTVSVQRHDQTSGINRNVVLQPLYPRANTESTDMVLENWDDLAANWAPRGYVYEVGTQITCRLEIYNFGPRSASGTVDVVLPQGFSLLSPPSDLKLQVDGMASRIVELKIGTPHVPTSDEVMIAFRGVFDGLPTTASASRWKAKK